MMMPLRLILLVGVSRRASATRLAPRSTEPHIGDGEGRKMRLKLAFERL